MHHRVELHPIFPDVRTLSGTSGFQCTGNGTRSGNTVAGGTGFRGLWRDPRNLAGPLRNAQRPYRTETGDHGRFADFCPGKCDGGSHRFGLLDDCRTFSSGSRCGEFCDLRSDCGFDPARSTDPCQCLPRGKHRDFLWNCHTLRTLPFPGIRVGWFVLAHLGHHDAEHGNPSEGSSRS